MTPGVVQIRFGCGQTLFGDGVCSILPQHFARQTAGLASTTTLTMGHVGTYARFQCISLLCTSACVCKVFKQRKDAYKDTSAPSRCVTFRFAQKIRASWSCGPRCLQLIHCKDAFACGTFLRRATRHSLVCNFVSDYLLSA